MQLTRTTISIFLGVAVLTWMVTLWWKGVALDWRFIAPFGTTVSVLAFFGLLIEHWLWRQRWAASFFKRPDLRGTWRVEMESSWKASDDARPLDPIVGYMAIKQTLSTLQMHRMTAESESWLIAEAVLPAPHGDSFRIGAIYESRPNLKLRETGQSPWQQGAFILTTHGPLFRPDKMAGDYWTDQKTTGTMTLTDRKKTVATCYQDAEQL